MLSFGELGEGLWGGALSRGSNTDKIPLMTGLKENVIHIS